MKKKISITIDEELLKSIDQDAEANNSNRSRQIETRLRRLQGIAIAITHKDLKDWLEGRLERQATEKELAEFKGTVERDVPQFLTDNCKYFVRECLEDL